MTEVKRVSDIGEFGLIEELGSLFSQSAGSDVRVGIGDDAAVVSWSETWDLVLTCDAMIEREHFSLGSTPPHILGQKALATNLSDIAAMGAEPKYALLTLGCPPDAGVEDVMEIGRGMCETASEYGVAVVGGDTVRNKPGVIVAITVVGVVKRGTALLRSGANAGDALFVTGTLGDSGVGLHLLTRSNHDARVDPQSLDYLKNRHLLPTPRVKEGKLLSSSGLATAAIDVSDGLCADLGHICEQSGVGAVIQWDAVPISKHAQFAAQGPGIDLAPCVLGGGEDYELVFCCKPEDAAGLRSLLADPALAPVTQIGEIVEGSGVRVEGLPERAEDTPAKGFDHFANH